MSDSKSIYPRIETGYAYTPEINDEILEKFKVGIFTQRSASLKIKYHNPKNLIVQHLPVKEREKEVEINRMRNGYIADVLNSVDNQEIVKIGGKVVEVYAAVIYLKNFKVSPSIEFIDKIFDLRQKNKDENNDVMQLIVKLIINSLYGEQIRKDIEKSFHCKFEHWMQTEFDERVSDYQKFIYGSYILKMKDDAGLDDEVKKSQHYAITPGRFRIIK